MDMESEKFEQFVRLVFLQLREGSYEAAVYVQGFETCDRVGADSWVMGVDWWSVGANLPGIKDRVV
jgi:hypothetical protein